MTELRSLTLIELSEALKARRASPVELMRDVLDALDRHNPVLNAVVSMRTRDALLSDAHDAEARIAAGRGRPLEGIPLGVKDLEDAAGLATTHGSKPFRDAVASHDSTQVARLRAAGAIVLGKTNAPEFGSAGITRNLLFGATGSPWDPSRTPGGSSGGSAAALAGELLPLVTASDGGGSIRIPASFVGAFGLKPSFGRVPTGPVTSWEYGATVVYGPLTKTVEDGALFLDVVAGHDARDATSLPHPGYSYLDAVRRPLERKLRIAYSADLGYAVVQPDIAAAVEDAVLVFQRLGHDVRAIGSGPPEMNGEWGLLSSLEIGARIAHLRPERDRDFGRALLETMSFVEALSPQLWATLRDKRARIVRWCADLFDEFDLLVTPTVPYDPPPAKGPLPSETAGRPQITASVASFTIPFNLSWNPAATVRAGLSTAGFPVGMQLVGPLHREDVVLQAARAFERERPWHPHWPLREAAS
ncbi:MAG TPA: amidase [Polyangiaceae bacterium]|jgi:aspartyl-tRNA(Asn)/glutamyl-tRNA(Gln) amidotransferase subunit A|nr:amidase [Polyangiaceae bacterium]